MLTIIDFGELPVFQEASNFPAIFIWQEQPRDDTPTIWLPVMRYVSDLSEVYERGLRKLVQEDGIEVPPEQFHPKGPRLAHPRRAQLRQIMEKAGVPLGEVVEGRIYRGILTGCNEAFIIDRATRDRLIEEDPNSEEIIKPIVVGDDIRRYEIHFRERYLIWTYVGVPIRRYPAIYRHLRQYKERLENRWDKGDCWYELRPCDYYDEFQRPKVVWGEIAMTPRFAVDTQAYFLSNTAYLLVGDHWFLVAILNSIPAWEYLRQTAFALGEPDARGRVRCIRQFVERLPIPCADREARRAVYKLSQEAQALHAQRRRTVERFLLQLGTSAAQSSSKSQLERPWAMPPEQFQGQLKKLKLKPREDPMKAFLEAREETAELTRQIEEVEREIDERVAALYGLALSDFQLGE